MARLVALIALILALGLSACGGDDDEGNGAAADGGETPAQSETAPGDQATAQRGCPEVEQPPAKEDGGQEAPEEPLDPSSTWEVSVRTSCGEFTIMLDPESAPQATASFAALAEAGFYDDTYFHRIVPGFVIQGGDPTGTGTGGPGYSTEDEPASDSGYTRGVVAMAKAGNEPPGTAGSQFFVVTGEDTGLPPEYAIIGEVTEGMEVVERIGQLGDASERPLQVVTIEGMEVKES